MKLSEIVARIFAESSQPVSCSAKLVLQVDKLVQAYGPS